VWAALFLAVVLVARWRYVGELPCLRCICCARVLTALELTGLDSCVAVGRAKIGGHYSECPVPALGYRARPVPPAVARDQLVLARADHLSPLLVRAIGLFVLDLESAGRRARLAGAPERAPSASA